MTLVRDVCKVNDSQREKNSKISDVEALSANGIWRKETQRCALNSPLKGSHCISQIVLSFTKRSLQKETHQVYNCFMKRKM